MDLDDDDDDDDLGRLLHARGSLGDASAASQLTAHAVFDSKREMLGGGTAPVLGFDSWDRINQLELERGKAAGKVREKIIDVREMLTAAQ